MLTSFPQWKDSFSYKEQLVILYSHLVPCCQFFHIDEKPKPKFEETMDKRYSGKLEFLQSLLKLPANTTISNAIKEGKYNNPMTWELSLALLRNIYCHESDFQWKGLEEVHLTVVQPFLKSDQAFIDTLLSFNEVILDTNKGNSVKDPILLARLVVQFAHLIPCRVNNSLIDASFEIEMDNFYYNQRGGDNDLWKEFAGYLKCHPSNHEQFYEKLDSFSWMMIVRMMRNVLCHESDFLFQGVNELGRKVDTFFGSSENYMKMIQCWREKCHTDFPKTLMNSISPTAEIQLSSHKNSSLLPLIHSSLNSNLSLEFPIFTGINRVSQYSTEFENSQEEIMTTIVHGYPGSGRTYFIKCLVALIFQKRRTRNKDRRKRQKNSTKSLGTDTQDPCKCSSTQGSIYEDDCLHVVKISDIIKREKGIDNPLLLCTIVLEHLINSFEIHGTRDPNVYLELCQDLLEIYSELRITNASFYPNPQRDPTQRKPARVIIIFDDLEAICTLGSLDHKGRSIYWLNRILSRFSSSPEKGNSEQYPEKKRKTPSEEERSFEEDPSDTSKYLIIFSISKPLLILLKCISEFPPLLSVVDIEEVSSKDPQQTLTDQKDIQLLLRHYHSMNKYILKKISSPSTLPPYLLKPSLASYISTAFRLRDKTPNNITSQDVHLDYYQRLENIIESLVSMSTLLSSLDSNLVKSLFQYTTGCSSPPTFPLQEFIKARVQPKKSRVSYFWEDPLLSIVLWRESLVDKRDNFISLESLVFLLPFLQMKEEEEEEENLEYHNQLSLDEYLGKLDIDCNSKSLSNAVTSFVLQNSLSGKTLLALLSKLSSLIPDDQHYDYPYPETSAFANRASYFPTVYAFLRKLAKKFNQIY